MVVDITRALDADLADPRLSPRSWSRLHVGRRLMTMHRQHLGTKMRDAGPEVSLSQGSRPEAGSAALTSMILGRHTSPTRAAAGAERMLSVPEPPNWLDPFDREALALRHLSTSAAPRRPSSSAPRKRRGRNGTSGLKRLKDMLATRPGGWEGL